MAYNESYRVGDSDQDFISFPMIVTKTDYDYADLPLTVPVPENFLILGVGHYTETAFLGDTLQVGYTGATTYWLTYTNIVQTTAARFVHSLGSTSSGANVGKLYSGTHGEVLVSASSTGFTQGAGSVYLFMFDLGGNWRHTP